MGSSSECFSIIRESPGRNVVSPADQYGFLKVGLIQKTQHVVDFLIGAADEHLDVQLLGKNVRRNHKRRDFVSVAAAGINGNAFAGYAAGVCDVTVISRIDQVLENRMNISFFSGEIHSAG